MQQTFNKNFIDLSNMQFDLVLVENYSHSTKTKSGQNQHYWNCKCDCGNKFVVLGSSLKSGNTKSCGCLKQISKKKHNLIGQRFGMLVVVSESAKKSNQIHWNCKCDCGNETVVAGNNLKSKQTKTCGCKQGNFKHGLCGTKEYKKYLLSDPIRKLKHRISVSVRDALRSKKCKKGGRTFDALPYTVIELKEHLEALWEPWMNWENYGGKSDDKRKTWQIDHINLHSSFNYNSINDKEFIECWSLSNLRPLEKIANFKRKKK